MSGSGDGSVKVWDVENRKVVLTLQAGQKVRCVRFSPDGKTIAASGGNGKIMVWESEPVSDDVARKQLAQRLSPPALGVPRQ